MRVIRFLFLLLGIAAVVFINSCGGGKDPEPTLAELSVDAKLQAYFADSSITVMPISIGEDVIYYEAVETFADSSDLLSGSVIYFHYSISLIEAELDSSARDTIASETTLITFSQQPISVVALHGGHALFPIGLDTALSRSPIRNGETYNYYLPPNLAFGEIPFTGIPVNSIVKIGFQLDSVKSELEVFSEQQLAINQYIIDAELRDTTVVPGGPVTEIPVISGNAVYTKVLGDTTTNPFPQPIDLIEIGFNYRYITDSINDAGFRTFLGTRNYETGGFIFTYLDENIIQGLGIAIRQVRAGERSLFLINAQHAYQESVCFVPDLRNTFGSFWSSPETREFFLINDIVPEYAFQVEPYQSLAMEVRLISLN